MFARCDTAVCASTVPWPEFQERAAILVTIPVELKSIDPDGLGTLALAAPNLRSEVGKPLRWIFAISMLRIEKAGYIISLKISASLELCLTP